MDDLNAVVERVAEFADWMKRGDPGAEGSVMLAASVADEHASDIRRILAERSTLLDALRERGAALEPFAKAAEGFGSWIDCQSLGVIVTWEPQHFTVGDLNRAKAALTGSPET